MACSKDHGGLVNLNQTPEEQAHFMHAYDLAKASLKDSKEGKSKDALPEKRKRDTDGAELNIGEGKQPAETDASKRPRTDGKGATYKSLFITSSTLQSEM